MSAKPLISVVLTTYNRSDALAVVLAALQRQTDTDFEVVIADDGSQPVHRARIREVAHGCSFALAHVWHPDVGFTVVRCLCKLVCAPFRLSAAAQRQSR